VSRAEFVSSGGVLDIWAAIVLALIQGLTEFLPISSAAHLILVPQILGWPDQGLAFDVAVHLGTLFAVIWYFHGEVVDIVTATLGSMFGRAHDPENARLGWAILIATIPVVLAGFLMEDFVEHQLRSPVIIAIATAFFGVLLWVADLRRNSVDDEHKITLLMAFLIGVAQVLALIPGTSRSGITMTAGLGLGLSRQTAARFSFLMSMPAIAGASVLETFELTQSPGPVPWVAMLVGLLVAAVSAYFCIRLFLNVIERIGMLPFMLYRLLLAAVLMVVFI
jgi:undecaprenyl-diphosphatase